MGMSEIAGVFRQSRDDRQGPAIPDRVKPFCKAAHRVRNIPRRVRLGLKLLANRVFPGSTSLHFARPNRVDTRALYKPNDVICFSVPQHVRSTRFFFFFTLGRVGLVRHHKK